ncbi:helix-turn-helix domain-containing protein [Agathobaculum desmolans]|uniref:helix-turn-helix domain-containing protein n=1 Tax=Agathobaculum desmolans TaxID=39484 RepID=UPI0039B9720B
MTGASLKALRKSAGLTQQQLSDQAGVNVSLIRKLVRKPRNRSKSKRHMYCPGDRFPWENALTVYFGHGKSWG